MNRASARRGAMRIALVSAAAAAFAVSGAACSRSSPEDTVYCVDQNRRVVDDDYCDDGNSRGGSSHGYYLWHRSGRYSHPKGTVVSGGELVRTDDAAGRSRLGMTSTGHVNSGPIARGGIGGGGGDGHGSSGG